MLIELIFIGDIILTADILFIFAHIFVIGSV